MEGQTGADGVKYCLVIRAVSGNPYIKGRTLHCDGNAEILMTSQTSFYCDNYLEEAVKTLDQAEKLGYEELKKRHVADVSELMNRCILSIECEDKSDLPTDERLERIKSGGEDNGLINLAFAYGRYLLIASSREGSLPANLQGIWNDSFTPVWDSKYTININTQMNYWCAENTGLSELHKPLFDHIKRMVDNGKHVAEKCTVQEAGWLTTTPICGETVRRRIPDRLRLTGKWVLHGFVSIFLNITVIRAIKNSFQSICPSLRKPHFSLKIR